MHKFTQPSRVLRQTLATLLLSGFALAQGPVTNAPGSVLQGFHTTKATMQDLSLPAQAVAGFEVDVSLGGKTYTLILREHDVRAKDFKLVVADRNGERVVPTPANTTYRGVVRGFGGSRIAASLVDGQLTAIVRFQLDQPAWNIQPLTEVLPAGNRATHVMHNAGDNNVPQNACGTNGIPTQSVPVAGANGNGNTVYECEIACDADYEKYLRHGSNVNNTQADLTGIINACSVIYERDVSVEFKITQIIVRTSRTYTSNDPYVMLPQYAQRWRSSHGGIRRDISHLFTAKSRATNVIGLAYLGTVCSNSSGYGLSFTNFTSNYTSRVGLTAHEVGHSFNSGHCSGGSCYIMCAGLGGCGRSLTRFGTASINAITSFRNSRSCLRQSNPGLPTITSMTPTRVNAFRGGQITVTGTNFTGALEVRVGSRSLTPGTTPRSTFQVLSPTTIRFEAPTSLSLFPDAITVANTFGRSNNAILTYKETEPVILDAPLDAVRGQPYAFEYGGGFQDPYFLIASPTANTFQFMNENWLTVQVLMLAGTLSPAGYGSFIVPTVPQSATVGLKFYSQVITIDFITNTFDGNSNVISTTIR